MAELHQAAVYNGARRYWALMNTHGSRQNAWWKFMLLLRHNSIRPQKPLNICRHRHNSENRNRPSQCSFFPPRSRSRVLIIEEVHMTVEVHKPIRRESRCNLIRCLWRITLCVWLVGQFVIVESSWAAEGALSVIQILIDGHAADTVGEAAIIPAGKKRAEKRVLRIGTTIEQGAEIVVPRRTSLILKSANGNRVRLQPGSRFKINVVSGEGETYTPAPRASALQG